MNNTILIVDDSLIDVLYLEHIVKKSGYSNLLTATNPNEALTILKQNTPSQVDLILMDVEMPEMSGIEACRLIKSTSNFKDIPIILITGKQDISSYKLGLGVGAHDYIIKPINESDLIPRIYSALKLKQEIDLRKARELELIEANRLLEQERQITERLIHNILPAKIAKDLKNHGRTAPELYENVTVLFSDIVKFTETASMLDPESLIEELNDIFTEFDNIMEKNRCERIKTVGDAYLAVCGMPEPNEFHSENVIRAAIDMLKYLTLRNSVSLIQWQVRIGVHTGKVVGSVVGVKKYIYDIFGDTVNTAARLQSNSEPMQINISQTTYELVKNKFDCIQRPPMMVKGKGLMHMYFVEKLSSPVIRRKDVFTLSDLLKNGSN